MVVSLALAAGKTRWVFCIGRLAGRLGATVRSLPLGIIQYDLEPL